MQGRRPGLLTRTVVAATALTVLTGLIGQVPASAAGTPAASTSATAAQLPEATQEEKVNAIRTLGFDIDNSWLVLRDRDFVFKIFDTTDEMKNTLVKAAALQAYRDGDAAATQFIRTDIYALDRQDKENYARTKLERDQARKLKQSAAALIAMPVTDQQLDLGYRDFIYDMWRFVTGYPKVKAGLLDAFGADEPAQKVFLASGLLAAKRQDQQDAIDADKAKTEADKARDAARNARANAATVVLLQTTDAMLDLPDDFFIRKLLEKAVAGSEVAKAAQAALNSSAAADWRAFLVTGIFAADKRDVEIARERKAAEDRQRLLQLKAKAEAGGMRPRLVAAAAAALAGGADAVAAFLAKDVQQAGLLDQALEVTTPGYKGRYVQSSGGDAWTATGDAGTSGTAKVGAATWTVTEGLADPDCFSLKSTEVEGAYLRIKDLRVQLAANDGTDAFKRDATWCSKPGLSGTGVSLEVKSQPGRFLRHVNAQMWAANNSGANWFDADRLFLEDASWAVVGPDPVVTTPITTRWLNDDAFHAAVGNPKADEVYDANGVNGLPVRYRDFDKARVYFSDAAGVHAVSGAALEKYKSVGEYHWLLPIIDTTGTPDGIGSYTHFQNGASIYWSPNTGAHLVYGAIRTWWENLGWEKSYLGYPLTDESPAGNLRRSTFEHGNIDHDPATGRTWDYRV
ncbi:AbfB domain-containing protein [Amycolatopsis sp. NEAU-NG30]|uniref:AbfB domain-containing protein n=1 Tax=Amycolatopsis melonis TaxID=3156488 RepID=A0ABV0LU29_9PSEU